MTLQSIIDRLTGKERREAAQVVLAAYLVLLQIPYTSPLRTASQSTMARCVNFIAETLGVEPEYVQTECESTAIRLGMELEDAIQKAQNHAR